MATNSVILGLTALVFSTWSVSLAGIASVQSECQPGWSLSLAGINGLSNPMPCMTLFRYYWFIVCIEFVFIVALGAAFVLKSLPKARLSFIGLFAVATLLYIQMTDMSLTLDSVTSDMTGQIKHRVRTLIAGSIMTATINSIIIIALGSVPVTEAEETPAEAPAGKAAAV